MKKKAFVYVGFKSLSVKILLVVISIIMLVVAICVFVTVYQNNTYSDSLIMKQNQRAFADLQAKIESSKNICLYYANYFANDEEIIRSVDLNDLIYMKTNINATEIAGAIMAGDIDFMEVVNNSGQVMYTSAMAIGSQAKVDGTPLTVQNALNGEKTAGIFLDSSTGLYYSAASPVVNENGDVVGAIATISFLNEDTYFDDLKQSHDMDFTLYLNDTSYITTHNANEKRAVGVKLPSEIKDAVLTRGEEFSGILQLNGLNYLARYTPFKDYNGNTIGVLFAGLPITEIQATRQNSLVISLGITGCVVLISILALMLFVRKSIKKPLLSITQNAVKLAEGQTDIILDMHRKDEIGTLAISFDRMAQAIKSLANDTTMLVEAALNGNLSMRSDTQTHEGDYRKIVEGINDMLDAVVIPINEAADVLSKMSQGKLDVSVLGDYKGDHAIIKNALNQTLLFINSYINEITEVLGKISSGHLDVGIKSEYMGDFLMLKDSINNICDSLNHILYQINSTSHQVATGTRQVSDGSQSISSGASEQASAIEELTASVSQISSQIQLSAINAVTANEHALAARNDAVTGFAQMQEMRNAVSDINDTTTNISSIIKVIDDIAFQTNILSLNAAVEAARAGFHGKGFAVVADEVRMLAARSSKAAQETATLILDAKKKTQAGTVIADRTTTSLENILRSVDNAAQLIGEIAVSSKEQAIGMAQIDKGIEQILDVVQTNSAIAQESAAASEELYSQAEMLKNMVARFHLKNKSELEGSDQDYHNITSNIYACPSQENTEEYLSEEPLFSNQENFINNSNDFGKF